ncbi:MAG: RNA polymerase sigma factor [Gemmatimonadaceae bacterium]
MNSPSSQGSGDPAASGDPTDHVLLAQVAAGDHDAIGALIRRYVRPVTLFAEQITGDRDTAEDVAQETFLIVMRKAESVNLQGAAFGSWLYVIARNLARRHRARRQRRLRILERWGDRAKFDPGPTRTMEAREMLGRVAHIVNGLPPMQRQCFELHFVSGFDVEEVARMFGISTATVRQHVFRARRVIRARLSPTEEE